jgi:hypothetical protein
LFECSQFKLYMTVLLAIAGFSTVICISSSVRGSKRKLKWFSTV